MKDLSRGTVMGSALANDGEAEYDIHGHAAGGFAAWAPTVELDDGTTEYRGWVPKRGLPEGSQKREAGMGASRATMTTSSADAKRAGPSESDCWRTPAPWAGLGCGQRQCGPPHTEHHRAPFAGWRTVSSQRRGPDPGAGATRGSGGAARKRR